MKVTPKSKKELEDRMKEIQEKTLLPKGIYEFEIFEAQEKISRSGNEMIELQLKIRDSNDKIHIVFDYLLNAMEFKLRHFAECVGLLEEYQHGNLLAADCLFKKGKAEIIIQAGQDNPQGGKYPPKNSIKDYVINETSDKVATTKMTEKEFFNDDLPF